MVIQHNLTAMNAYRQSGINNHSANKSLEKLSSGFRINRAADDASGLGISEKMRGQIRGTMMGTQNTHMGINLVQTAEGALNETHSILQRMRELAVQSSNGTYHDQVDRENLEKEYQALKSEVDRIAESTHYNGIKLIDGSHPGASSISGSMPAPDGYIAGALADAGINESMLSAYGTLLCGGNANPMIPADRFIGISDIILTWNAEASMWDYHGTCETSFQGEKTTFLAEGSLDPLNPVTMMPNGFEELSIVYWTGDTRGPYLSFFSGQHMNEDGSLKSPFFIPTDGIKDGTMIVLQTISFPVEYTPYVFIPNPDNEPSDDITAEKGKIIIQYGANSPDNLKIEISDMRAQALGINATSIRKIDSANKSISSLDKAVNLVSAERANLGAFQNRLETIVRDNEVKTENLQAAESTIRDVDMAKEMMEFTKNNILAQAAQSMLAQANQLPQGVLQLLR